MMDSVKSFLLIYLVAQRKQVVVNHSAEHIVPVLMACALQPRIFGKDVVIIT